MNAHTFMPKMADPICWVAHCFDHRQILFESDNSHKNYIIFIGSALFCIDEIHSILIRAAKMTNRQQKLGEVKWLAHLMRLIQCHGGSPFHSIWGYSWQCIERAQHSRTGRLCVRVCVCVLWLFFPVILLYSRDRRVLEFINYVYTT